MPQKFPFEQVLQRNTIRWVYVAKLAIPAVIAGFLSIIVVVEMALSRVTKALATILI